MKPLGHAKLDPVLAALHTTVGRAVDGGTASFPEIDDLFGRFGEQMHLILSEHAGMADELLRAYEQLGIVFEVTRKLSTVQTEDAVFRLFLDSLRVTYHDNAIFTVSKSPNDMLCWSGTPRAVDLAGEAVRESIATGKVVVRVLAEPVDGVTQMLAAPVFAGPRFFRGIVFTHGCDARRFVASDMSLVEALVLFCGDLIRNYQLAHELRSLSVDMVRALVNAIDQKDEYTSGHSNRVGHFAKLLGEELKLDREQLQMLEWAALLHDVGKIGIRDDVLKKPGKLTDEEFEHIKEHPVRSYEVVRDIPHLEAALDGVRHHHEHWDGTGYPDGLAAEDIPLQARIIQVADIFDALTTSRSYRSAFSWEKAIGILRKEAGTVVDPSLVPVFERIIERQIAEKGLRFESEAPESAAAGLAGRSE